MLGRSILWIAIFLIANHRVFTDQRLGKISEFQINVKKPIHVVADKFLSFTIDPTSLIQVSDCQTSNATVALVRGLLPAYLRVAGADSNRLVFKSTSDGNDKFASYLGSTSNSMSKSKNLLLSANQWHKFYEFVSKTGLNLIACLSGGIFSEGVERDLSNALEFIAFSNKNNFSTNWQLGYEVQKISKDDGKETGQDVAKLRKILEVFPRYQNSIVLGPDMTNFDSRGDILFVRNYLTQAHNSLNAFTIHPNFSSIREEDTFDALSNIFAKMDAYLWLRDGVFKAVSKGVVPKKPIWIAESENKDAICKFSDATSLIKRLGFAAKLGTSVYLRKPHLLSLYEPTSEYWASSLFKALVGRSVLDTRLVNGNNSTLFAFSHCTQILDKPEESVLNPMVGYERGSVTVYGVNADSEPSRLIFKTAIRSEETVHLYVLTEEVKNGLTNTLLNRQHLGLSVENDLPMVSPKILESAKYVVMPPRSIFFAVFPNIKCRACVIQPTDIQDGQKSKFKPTIVVDEEQSPDNSGSPVNNISEYIEEEDDDSAVYVSYPSKSERMRAAQKHSNVINEAPVDKGQTFHVKPDTTVLGPKYITFSDDTWLSSFPEKFEQIQEEPYADEIPTNIQTRKDKFSKLEKYTVMAKAMLGRRNLTGEFSQQADDYEPNTDEKKKLEKIKKLVRITRSIDSSSMDKINSFAAGNWKSGGDSRDDFVPQPYPAKTTDEVWARSSDADVSNVKQNDAEQSTKSQPEIRIFSPPNTRTSTNYTTKSSEISPTEKQISLMKNPLSLNAEIEAADVDQPNNQRESREIDVKNLKILRSVNAANNLGPVSPFPAHLKPKKMASSKSVRIKKSETISAPSKLDSNVPSLSAENRENVNKESTQSVSQSNSERSTSLTNSPNEDVVSQNIAVPASYQMSTAVGKSSESETYAAISSTADSNGKSATENRPTIPKSSQLPAARLKNKKNGVPVRANTHQSRSKDTRQKFKINAATNAPKTIKPQTKLARTSPSQLLDLYHAKLQEYRNLQMAKIDELKKKLQERSANIKVPDAKIPHHSRNRREITDAIESAKQANELNLNERFNSTKDDVVTSPSDKYQGRMSHASAHNTPLKPQSKRTRTIPPKKENPLARVQPDRAKNNHRSLHYTTTKKPLTAVSKHKIVNTPTRHHHTKRDILEDTMKKASEAYEEISADVKKKFTPIESWIKNNVIENVKKEFVHLRDRRDLETLRQRIKEKKEKIREKLAGKLHRHRISARDVGVHSKKTFKLPTKQQLNENGLENHRKTSAFQQQHQQQQLNHEKNRNEQLHKERKISDNFKSHIRHLREITENDELTVGNKRFVRSAPDGESKKNEEFLENTTLKNETITAMLNNSAQTSVDQYIKNVFSQADTSIGKDINPFEPFVVKENNHQEDIPTPNEENESRVLLASNHSETKKHDQSSENKVSAVSSTTDSNLTTSPNGLKDDPCAKLSFLPRMWCRTTGLFDSLFSD